MGQNIITAVHELYQELPQVDCKKCGLCCVSPTCTLSEFLFLFDHIRKNCSPAIITRYLSAPAALHPDYEGNLRCPFLAGTLCEVHPARTGACRLFGIPSLKELGISNLEQCRNSITVVSGNGSLAAVQSWLEKLMSLEKTLYRADEEPYFIKGFNIQCWLDIYFDDSLDFDIFREIKNSMHRYIDLQEYAGSYKPQTGLKDKIDKITIFSSLLNCGDRATIQPLLLSIRDDYPATGTYFFEESNAFLSTLDGHPQ